MQGNCVNAIYSREQGNPYLEALPDVLGKREFGRRIKSQPDFPRDISRLAPEERRNLLSGLSQWFQPMDYMYTLYDMLHRAMCSTYQTKTVIESVRQMNDLYTKGVILFHPSVQRSGFGSTGHWQDLHNKEMPLHYAAGHRPSGVPGPENL